MTVRNPYAEACKQDAVKLVLERGMTASHVARDLGVGFDTLQRWVRAARSSHIAERVRLQRDVEQLRMERDIVQKARGICSRMPQ